MKNYNINKKGAVKYVPKIANIELSDIKREDEIFTNIEAWNKFVKYARVGREVNRMSKLNWKNKKPLPPVPCVPGKLKYKKIKPKKSPIRFNGL